MTLGPHVYTTVQTTVLDYVYDYTQTAKVTIKVINQDRMFFADFSVNCQPIFMKFCNNHISTES